MSSSFHKRLAMLGSTSSGSATPSSQRTYGVPLLATVGYTLMSLFALRLVPAPDVQVLPETVVMEELDRGAA